MCGGVSEVAMKLGSLSDTGQTRVVEDSVAEIKLGQNIGFTRWDGGSGLGTETGVPKEEYNGSQGV